MERVERAIQRQLLGPRLTDEYGDVDALCTYIVCRAHVSGAWVLAVTGNCREELLGKFVV